MFFESKKKYIIDYTRDRKIFVNTKHFKGGFF